MATVLIVDDASFMKMMLRDIITKGEYEIVGEAANGIEAINKYKELKPDIVTMDITMPELDGIGAVKKIKEFDDNAKILMCSAMGQQAMVIEAVKSGASGFIVKPFEHEKVLESLSSLLNK